MKFTQLTDAEFKSFASDHPQTQFAQSVEFAKMQLNLGQATEILGIKRGQEILAAGVVVWHLDNSVPFGQFYLGPLFDPNDQATLNFFTKELKKYTKGRGAAYCTISPYISYKTLSQAGELQSINDDTSIANFRRAGFRPGYDVIPKFIFKKDSQNFQSEKELFKDFTQNTRTAIRSAEQNYVTVRPLGYSELDILKSLMEATAQRQGFKDKTFEYYKELYKQFSDSKEYKADFMVAELDLAKLSAFYKDQKKKLQAQIDDAEAGQKKELNNQLAAIVKREESIKKFHVKSQKVPISAGIYIWSKREVVYLFGGSDPKYLQFNGVYAIVWHQLRKALAKKTPVFNFYGVSGVFDRRDSRYGVLKFKQGFNGYIEQLVGGFYVVAKPLKFWPYRILSKIKNKIIG